MMKGLDPRERAALDGIARESDAMISTVRCWSAINSGSRNLNGLARMAEVLTEAFAPLVSVMPFDTFDQALSMVNDSSYGLNAGVFTCDLREAFQAVEELEVGSVIVNDSSAYRADHMPYGGVKSSGLGREGVRFAMEEMTEIKLAVIRLPDA